MSHCVSDSPTPPADQGLGDVLREYMEVTNRLQATHERLQDEVVRLRRELASKDRELELRRRLAALGEMAAGVAHEVRNPLGAIRLYSGLLRDQCRELAFEPGLQLVEKIEAGIQAIDAVVQDTLALAPRDRRLGACHVATILERARDATLKALTARAVELEMACEPPDVYVRGDADGVQRVLVNLIVNAAEVSSRGQVVRVRVEAGADDTIALRVVDEGPGIADEIRDRVFDPFFTTKEQGTGLGLTIAHRLSEAYGGRLTVANRPGGGAEFTVLLPRAAAPDVRAEPGAGARGFGAA